MPAPQKPAAAAEVVSGSFGSFLIGGPSVQAEVGHPYSAEQITERVQTLADGTRITQPGPTIKLYRDWAGRTRTEHTFPLPPGAVVASQPSFIQIVDPVAIIGIPSIRARRQPAAAHSRQ